MPSRPPGPDIDGSSIPEKKLRLQRAALLNEGAGLRRERDMCEKANKKEFRCQTELEYLTEAEAVSLNLPPDTRLALHKCVRPGSREGAFVPVTSAEEAVKVSEAFCECVKQVDPLPPPRPVAPKAVVDAQRRKCAR